ncbi:MAG TPA: SgcJ/EcaC family oxidoreductase [Terriglobia bacterium]|nr:SgcJ/EcaC family oxidoreductase [Terriglobia bacterium]
MKRSILAVSVTSLLALVLASCSQAPQTSDTHDADVQAIKDNEAQWNKDFQAKDVDKLLAHYTDDAVLMSPGAPPWNGKDSIRAGLKEMVSDNALSLSFTPDRVEVAKSGDFAYTEGGYTMNMTDPATQKPISDKGSYVTVYRKQADGSWKAVSDIASSATPPGPPPSKAM